LLARRSQQVLCLGLERGLKPLSNGCLGIIIKINLTTNYQLLLNCNKVHRALVAAWEALPAQFGAQFLALLPKAEPVVFLTLILMPLWTEQPVKKAFCVSYP
jgi:hypothetical protein